VVAIEVMVVIVVAAAPASAAVAGVNERGLWCALAKTLCDASAHIGLLNAAPSRRFSLLSVFPPRL
jgi:hypothetical protein